MYQISHYISIFFVSVLQALISTIISVTFALIFTYTCIYSYEVIKKLWLIFGLFCMVMPTQVCALSVLYALGVRGFFAIIVAHAIMNIPLLMYVLMITYNTINIHTIWIAKESGACNIRVYYDTIWPVIKPVVLCTSVMVFVYCLSSFWPPMILGSTEYHYTPDIFLYDAYKQCNWYAGFFFFLMRISVVVCILFYSSFYAQTIHFDSALISYTSRIKHSFVMSVLSLMGLVFLLYPFYSFVTAVNAVSLIHFFSEYPLVDLVMYSIGIALVSSCGAILIGLCCVYINLQLLALFPLALSSVGITIMFTSIAGILHNYTYLMIATTHVLLNYPFVYRMVYDYWKLFPQELLDLARSAGATQIQIVRTIIVPYLRPAIVKAWAFACVLSLVESGGASLIMSDKPLTLPLALKLCIKQKDIVGTVGLSLVLVCLVSCIIGVVQFVESKKSS